MGRDRKNVVLADMPFVVEPVSSERVRFWADFAGQASTRDAFNVVSGAFNAFWFEASAYEDFQHAARCLEMGLFPNAVSWADSVVGSLEYASDLWQRAIASMEQDQSMRAWALRWYTAVSEQLQAVSLVVTQVVSWVVSYCERMRWELPEHTQAYIASH